MRFRTKHKHMIDFLFPVALFFVFALSALTVILLAAKIYQSTTEHSSFNYTSRTCLSYIAEKIHQNDVGGTVSIGTFDGCDALVLDQAHGEDTYYTYIYVHENELKELFIKEGAEVTAADGKTVLKVEDFSMESLSDNLMQFHCVDENNQESSSVLCIRRH